MASGHANGPRTAVISLLSLSTGWLAALWHISFVTSWVLTGSYDTTLWVINITALLGLLTLTIPWLAFMVKDFRSAKQSKSARSLLAHVPNVLFICCAPWMYHPFSWILLVLGAG